MFSFNYNKKIFCICIYKDILADNQKMNYTDDILDKITRALPSGERDTFGITKKVFENPHPSTRTKSVSHNL
jgi:hypothetical protein